MAVEQDTLLTVFKTLGLNEYKAAFEQAAEANRKVAREEKKRDQESPVSGSAASLASRALRVGGALKQAAEALFFFREAIQTVGDAMTASLRPFAQQEQAFFRMNLVLRNLGREGEIGGLVDFNRQLSVMSGNTSASLAGLTALLVQFGLTDAEIRRTTPVLLDWSRAVGIDATRAADILGSALRNEKDAIQRYGVDIDLTRSRSEKLNQALEQLSARFRGGAQASAGTLLGSLERVNNALEETQARFNRLGGTIVTGLFAPLLGQLASLNALLDVFNAGLERLGVIPPLGGQAAGIGGANAAAINQGATEATQQEIAANTKKTADSLGNFGRFVIGGGVSAQAALNIRGLNAALRAGR